MDPLDIINRFSVHPPRTAERLKAHKSVRERCLVFAQDLNELLPDGREKSTAMTKLEEVMFHGNAAIAREDSKPKGQTH